MHCGFLHPFLNQLRYIEHVFDSGFLGTEAADPFAITAGRVDRRVDPTGCFRLNLQG